MLWQRGSEAERKCIMYVSGIFFPPCRNSVPCSGTKITYLSSIYHFIASKLSLEQPASTKCKALERNMTDMQTQMSISSGSTRCIVQKHVVQLHWKLNCDRPAMAIGQEVSCHEFFDTTWANHSHRIHIVRCGGSRCHSWASFPSR